MATKLPYVAQPGIMVKILDKVKDAKTPDLFTYDFLSTILEFKGGNARQFIPLAKKMGFLESNSSPTDLYNKFRNKSTSKAAMAKGIRTAYRDIFERNEYAENLKKEDFKGLVVEITGLEENNRVVQLICQASENLKQFAKFNAKLPGLPIKEDERPDEKPFDGDEINDFDLNLSYSINIVLPKTDDPAVFNAIFKSLRVNLLRK